MNNKASETQLHTSCSFDENRVQHLIELTRALADIFDQENTLLSTSRASQIGPLQTEKAKLANAYASAIKEVANNRLWAEGANKDLLQSLREATDHFNTMAAHQSTLLEGAHKATSGVISAIAHEARKTDSSNQPILNNYNKTGIQRGSAKPIVVTMNECA